MRMLYIDIDTLRPDHLGCYGYHRNTSPNIDALAAQSARFTRMHASDVPCLPSRTALHTGQFGFRNGVVNHGGTDADPVMDGAGREFWSGMQLHSLPTQLKALGMKTASVSSFAQRHSAFHWYAGFDEAYNVGKFGLETADEVHAIAADWLQRNGSASDWYLHVHFWDPHTPYRAPSNYGEPFAEEPLPAWLTETVRAEHWAGCGPHSAQEANGFKPRIKTAQRFPRQPQQVPDMAGVRQMFDGYDTGVLMADEYVGRLLNLLAELNLDDETVVVLSSDHGETLGELNVYGDHQTADNITTRIPALVRYPSAFAAGEYHAYHYQFDLFATLLELLGGKVPASWDAQSFASSLQANKAGGESGRDFLVVSQAAWACQRGVRVDDWMYIKTQHDAYHLYADELLFDLSVDPHQQQDLSRTEPKALKRCQALLSQWLAEQQPHAARGRDPHTNVMAEGGPYHVRGQLPDYLDRLRQTGRAEVAAELQQKWGE